MPNFSARILEQAVENTTLRYFVSVCAADGALYDMQVDVDGANLSSNIQNFNQAVKDAIEAQLLSQFQVTVGAGNKIVLMGGGV